MPGDLRAQVILKTVDAVPENYVSNSFSFYAVDPISITALLTPIIKTFYDTLVGYMSPVITQNGHEIKYSHLPGTPPNYPYDTDTFNLSAAPSGTAQPDELAVCLSFQGNRVAGEPQARKRGRIYFGPLDSTAIGGNRPNAPLITALAGAGDALGTAVIAIGAGNWWTVWSPTSGTSANVADGWVDNAFDIQRRRGVLPTSRTLFSL